MPNHDRAAKKADELAPCNRDCRNHFGDPTAHDEFCLANNRPAVAAALREAYAEIARLRAALQKAAGFKVDRCACVFIDDEPTVECAYHKTLRAELASIEQFAESWPCHCAENYPGATMYHGQDCQTAVAVEFVAQWQAAKVKR